MKTENFGPVYDCGSPDCEECQRAFGPDRSKAIAAHEAREKYYTSLTNSYEDRVAVDPCRPTSLL